MYQIFPQFYKYKGTDKDICTHTHTHAQTQHVLFAHAGSPSGFFHQMDLSQLIISSFEPWAQSMIALSINACMIYFDGASNDKCLACVCVCVCSCVRVLVSTCAGMCLHIYMNIFVFMGVYIPVHSCMTMSLCAFASARVCVWVSSGGSEPV